MSVNVAKLSNNVNSVFLLFLDASKHLNSVSVELVSKELNHLPAILHVYVVSLIFMNKKNIIFEKEKGNTFNHFYCEKSSKRAK